MKVIIKPPTSWFGPYHLTDILLPFINEDTRADIAEKLPNKPFELLDNLKQKIFKRDTIRIDYHDVWSMDYTLAKIVVPMLKLLKEKKHGIPADYIHTQDLDMIDYNYYSTADMFPETLEEFRGISEENWNNTMDKMIWSFEEIISDCDSDDPYCKPYYVDMTAEEIEEHSKRTDSLAKLIGKSTKKIDDTKYKEYHARIQEGLNLFGQHYRSLWD